MIHYILSIFIFIIIFEKPGNKEKVFGNTSANLDNDTLASLETAVTEIMK